MRKAKIKRILSVLCAAALLMTAFPVSALASENESRSEISAQSYETEAEIFSQEKSQNESSAEPSTEPISDQTKPQMQQEDTSSKEDGTVPDSTPSETGSAGLPDEEEIIDDVNIASPSDTKANDQLDEAPLMMMLTTPQDIPTIAEKQTWYKGTLSKRKITEVHFIDSFEEETVDETWEAGATEDDSITCYIVGTVLYICSNGSLGIKLSPSAYRFFYDFRKLSVLDGLEMLDSSETTDFSQFFYQCYALTDDIAADFFNTLDFSECTTLQNLFYNDTELKSFSFPENMVFPKLKSLKGAFSACQYLNTFNFNGASFPVLEDASSMFSGTNLFKIELSAFSSGTIKNVDSLLYNCQYLLSIDFTGFDTKSVTTANNITSECSRLESFTVDERFTLHSCISDPDPDYAFKTDGYWHSASTGLTYNSDSSWPDAADTYTSYVENEAPMIRDNLKWSSTYLDKTAITEIHFVDTYDGPGASIFSMDTDYRGHIRAFKEGTALYICGNGTGSIKAAKDSSSFFSGFSSLSEITGLEMVDFSETTTVSRMFGSCSAIDDDLALYIMENIGENAITSFYMFFTECNGLVNVIVPEDFDTSHAENIGSFFYRCANLESADLSGFNSETYTTVSSVISYCPKLKSLDLRGFDTSKVTSTSAPFYGNDYLEEITMDDAFTLKSLLPAPRATYIKGADGKWHSSSTWKSYAPKDTWPTGEDTYFAYDVSPCDLLTIGLYFTDYGVNRQDITTICFDLDYESDGTEQYTWILDDEEKGDIRGYILSDGKTLVVSAPGLEKIYLNPDSSDMFSVFNNVTAIEGLEYCDGSLIEDASYMFHACNSLESVNLENLISGSCYNCTSMFYGCKKLKEIDVTGWDTSNVQFMQEMFRECHELKELDLSGFDASTVTDMGFMFEKDYALANLKMFSDPANAKYMSYMFSECSSLEGLDLSDWKCTYHTDGDWWDGDDFDFWVYNDTDWHESTIFGAYEGMFRDCISLKKLNLSSMLTGNTTATADIFDGCIRLAEVHVAGEFNFCSQLPDPDSTYIKGATGLWYTKNGSGYLKEDIPAYSYDLYGYLIKKKITFGVREKSTGVYHDFGPDVLRYKLVSEDDPDEYIRFTVCFDENDDYSDSGRCEKDNIVYLAIGKYSLFKSGTVQKADKSSLVTITSSSTKIYPEAPGITRWGRAKATAYIGTL